jgi:hypothetical protein
MISKFKNYMKRLLKIKRKKDKAINDIIDFIETWLNKKSRILSLPQLSSKQSLQVVHVYLTSMKIKGSEIPFCDL